MYLLGHLGHVRCDPIFVGRRQSVDVELDAEDVPVAAYHPRNWGGFKRSVNVCTLPCSQGFDAVVIFEGNQVAVTVIAGGVQQAVVDGEGLYWRCMHRNIVFRNSISRGVKDVQICSTFDAINAEKWWHDAHSSRDLRKIKNLRIIRFCERYFACVGMRNTFHQHPIIGKERNYD